MYLDRLFRLMAEKQASDIFVSGGAPINIKINGVVHPVSTQPMDAETVRRIAYELMTDDQAREFESDMEMNISHLDPAVGNFRINIFRQRGSIALVVRYVRSTIPRFEQLQAAAGAARPGDGEARAGARRRRHRLGKVDHAGGDDRPPQQPTAPATSSPSRTRSSTCSSTRRASSTSARSTSTR